MAKSKEIAIGARNVSRVGTFLEVDLKKTPRPDRSAMSSEYICDLCGVKTKHLRKHNRMIVCWTCKIDLIEQ